MKCITRTRLGRERKSPEYPDHLGDGNWWIDPCPGADVQLAGSQVLLKESDPSRRWIEIEQLGLSWRLSHGEDAE